MRLFALTLVLAAGYLSREPENVLISRTLAHAGLLCTPDVPELRQSIRFLTQGTKFADHWTINRDAKRDGLNLYFFCPLANLEASRRILRLSYLLENCAYVGNPNIVVCDADFFKDFVTRSGIVNELPLVRPKPEEALLARRNVLL